MELVATDHQHPLFRLQQDLPQIKERTSFTPFTVHVRLLVMVTLCIRPVAFKSSILSIASHPPLLPEPDLQCIVWENVEIYT